MHDIAAIQPMISRLNSAHRSRAIGLVFVRTFWLAILLALVLTLADFLFAFSPVTRLSMDGLVIAAITFVAVYTYRTLRRSRSRARMLLRMIEEGNPEFTNTLINAADFEDVLKVESPEHVSADLMMEEIIKAGQNWDMLEGYEALRPRTLKKEERALICLVGIFVWSVLGFWSVFAVVVPRYLWPYGDFPPYSATKFEVDPGEVTIDYGEDLKVTVITSGELPKSVSLVLRDLKGNDVSEFLMFDSGDGMFFQTIENVQQDLVYFARIARGRSKRYTLNLMTTPRIEDVVITYNYPPYTRLKSRTRLLKDEGIKAYKNTKISMSISSNRPLKGGDLRVYDATLPLEVRSRHTVVGQFSILGEGSFSAGVLDASDNWSANRFEGEIAMTPDEKPEVMIENPGMDSFALPDVEVPIIIEAIDDLGVARIEIYRNHNGSQDLRKVVFTGDGADKAVRVIETLDMKDLGVRPGDIIDYYVTATDSEPDSPHTVATESFRLQIISYEEYREFMQSQVTATDLKNKYDDILKEFEELAAGQEQVQNETEKLRNKLEAEGSLTPEEEEALAKQQERQAKLAEIAEDLAERLEDEADRPEIFDIEKEYKEALRDFSERLKEALEHMKNAQENMGGQDGKEGEPGEPKEGQGKPGSLSAATEEQQKALEALMQNIAEFKEGIQQANENLEKVMDVMGDVEQFKYLYMLQKSLERQTAFYKEMQNPSLDDQIRLKELSEQQEVIKEALTALKDDLRAHAEDLDKLAEEAEASEPVDEVPEGLDVFAPLFNRNEVTI